MEDSKDHNQLEYLKESLVIVSVSHDFSMNNDFF